MGTISGQFLHLGQIRSGMRLDLGRNLGRYGRRRWFAWLLGLLKLLLVEELLDLVQAHLVVLEAAFVGTEVAPLVGIDLREQLIAEWMTVPGSVESSHQLAGVVRD